MWDYGAQSQSTTLLNFLPVLTDNFWSKPHPVCLFVSFLYCIIKNMAFSLPITPTHVLLITVSLPFWTNLRLWNTEETLSNKRTRDIKWHEQLTLEAEVALVGEETPGQKSVTDWKGKARTPGIEPLQRTIGCPSLFIDPTEVTKTSRRVTVETFI